MNCCQHHADAIPHGCNQGRSCPERMEFPITMEDDREDFESTNWDAISKLVRLSLILGALAMFAMAGWYFSH